MEIFINGMGIISPQTTLSAENLSIENLEKSNSTRLQCVEPDYKNHINPALLRRMSRMIKMGIASAQLALKSAQLEKPDAIIVGSGLGCIEDTEKFTLSIIDNKEHLLTPTPFIQSTHNTVSGQIALLLQCHEYNFTYVHRGLSFESALIDAILSLNENPNQSILVGGIDELTDNSFKLLQQLHISGRSSALASGEGAAFFVLSGKKSTTTLAKLKFVKTVNGTLSSEILKDKLSTLMKENSSSDKDVELTLNGQSTELLNSKKSILFKDYCGEYHTASAFAFGLAVQYLQGGTNNVLISNSYCGNDYSFIFLEK